MNRDIPQPERPLIDWDGHTIEVAIGGLVRVDGIPAFKLIEGGDKPRFQFYDGDRMRAVCRGTRLVEVPIQVLIEVVMSKGT